MIEQRAAIIPNAHPALPRPFPIQAVKGKAKTCQVRQLLKLIDQHHLELPGEDKDKEE